MCGFSRKLVRSVKLVPAREKHREDASQPGGTCRLYDITTLASAPTSVGLSDLYVCPNIPACCPGKWIGGIAPRCRPFRGTNLIYLLSNCLVSQTQSRAEIAGSRSPCVCLCFVCGDQRNLLMHVKEYAFLVRGCVCLHKEP